MNTQIRKQRWRYLFLALICTSCSNPPPEILKIEHAEKILYTEKFEGYSYVGKGQDSAYVKRREGFFKEEHFIVFNHPKNTSELTELINDFNRKTMPKDTILKYNRGYLRVFYKETRCTMEVYSRGNDTVGISAFDDVGKYYEYVRNSRIGVLEEHCYTEARLARIHWSVDSEQCVGITYYIYDDFRILNNVSDDELFNIK